MAHERNQTTRQLEQALNDARHGLLCGRLDHLAQNTLTVTECLDALSTTNPDAMAIHRIRTLARRNANLIEAAHRGLRLTMLRREALEAGPDGFGTYTATGDRRTNGPRNSYEHRS